MTKSGSLSWISGPVVRARVTGPLSVLEQVQVGEARLPGEVIALGHDVATIQVYEETNGLRPGEPLYGTGAPLSVLLGPGLLANTYDGLQRSLTLLRDRQGIYEGYIKITVTADNLTRSVAGTVFSDGRPRLIQIKDINLDAEFAPHMLYVTNEDKPGFIGRLGTALGDAKVNIASFSLGRSAPGADAIALVEVDGELGDDVLTEIRKLSLVKQAKALTF